MSDIAAAAAALGHDVDVVTALPNYPTGRIAGPYRRRPCVQERAGGIVVRRIWLAVSQRSGIPARLAGYISFAGSSLVASLALRASPDVVLANSPPLTVALSASVAARLRRARLVLNIEDIWPEAAAEIGLLPRGRLFAMARAAEEWAYRRSTLISGQTRGIVGNIRSRVPEARVVLLLAGVDTTLFSPEAADSSLARRFGMNDSFTVGYAGLHGLWQSLDTVVDAARLLKDRGDIDFVLIGDGPVKGDLQRRVARERLTNVRLFPPEPRWVIASVMPLWGAGVVPLISLPLSVNVLPVKLYELMASGVPVLFSGPVGEATGLISRVRCGIATPPGDGVALAEAVVALYEDQGGAATMAARGRAEAVRTLNRRILARDFVRLAVMDV